MTSIFDDKFIPSAVRATAHYHHDSNGSQWACWGDDGCPSLDSEFGPCEIAGCTADAGGVSRRCTAHLMAP